MTDDRAPQSADGSGSGARKSDANGSAHGHDQWAQPQLDGANGWAQQGAQGQWNGSMAVGSVASGSKASGASAARVFLYLVVTLLVAAIAVVGTLVFVDSRDSKPDNAAESGTSSGSKTTGAQSGGDGQQSGADGSGASNSGGSGDSGGEQNKEDQEGKEGKEGREGKDNNTSGDQNGSGGQAAGNEPTSQERCSEGFLQSSPNVPQGMTAVLYCDGQWLYAGVPGTSFAYLWRWQSSEWSLVRTEGEFESGSGGPCYTKEQIDREGMPPGLREKIAPATCSG